MCYTPENHRSAPFLLKPRGFLQQCSLVPSLMHKDIPQCSPWQPGLASQRYHPQRIEVPSGAAEQMFECLYMNTSLRRVSIKTWSTRSRHRSLRALWLSRGQLIHFIYLHTMYNCIQNAYRISSILILGGISYCKICLLCKKYNYRSHDILILHTLQNYCKICL